MAARARPARSNSPTAGAAASSSSSSSSSTAAIQYSVLLPTYNESENLPLIFALLDREFTAAGLGEAFEVVVVEDSSPDGTYLVALELQRVYGARKVRILKRAGKLGLGSAYIDGLALCRGEFVVLMDADLSHHPRFIPQMIAKQREGGFDCVTGTRYVRGGGVHGWDLRRKLISRVANFLATTLLNPRCSDLTGSFRLYRKSVLQKVMPLVQHKGYVFQMEVIVRCRQQPGFTIAEVPITFVDRVYGESKMGANEIKGYIKGLVDLFLEVDV